MTKNVPILVTDIIDGKEKTLILSGVWQRSLIEQLQTFRKQGIEVKITKSGDELILEPEDDKGKHIYPIVYADHNPNEERIEVRESDYDKEPIEIGICKNGYQVNSITLNRKDAEDLAFKLNRYMFYNK